MKTRKHRLNSAGLAIVLLVFSVPAAWAFRRDLKGDAYALLDLLTCKEKAHAPFDPVEARLVAHAGGAVRGLTYTNSREALDMNYAAGYRVFELDFHWTTDGRLVLVHDWSGTSAQFGVKPHVFSYAEFAGLRRRDGFHQLTFEDLRRWLHAHRDALVVTDTKDSNPRLIGYLGAYGADVMRQLVIQIYRSSELEEARAVGPRAVWFTVYRYAYPAWALDRVSGVDAFVIPALYYDRYRQSVLKGPAPYYVHSVPARSVDETFRQLPGIYGIFVD